MSPNPPFPADLVTFNEGILNEKTPFFCAALSLKKTGLRFSKIY